MDINQSAWLEFAKILQALITENIWAIVIIILLYFVRDGLGQFVKRLINFDFTWGDAKGSLKAESPSQIFELPFADSIKEDKPEKENIQQPSSAEEDDWFSQVCTLLRAGNIPDAKKVFDEHISTKTDPYDRYHDKIVFNHFSYAIASDKLALERNINLFMEAENLEEKELAAAWLSSSYRQAKNFTDEMNIWKILLKEDTSEIKKAHYIIRISSCLEEEKKTDDACSLIESNINSITDPKALGILFKKLGSLQSDRGDEMLASVAYEKALQYLPDDDDILFSAAYTQSNANIPFLSYFNYDTLINLKASSDSGLNNIGVQAFNLGMLGKSAQYYKRASDKDNTLAMANIAYLYISKGFYDEAEIALKKAIEYDKPHKNVHTALSELDKKRQEEEDILKNTLSNAVKQRDFLWSFSDARFMASDDAQDIDATWCSEDGNTINISQIDDKINCSWEDGEETALPTKKEHNISASRTNNALTGTYTIKIISQYTYTAPKTRTFIAIIKDTRLQIMFLDKENPTFMVLVKRLSCKENGHNE